jgi:putative DNA primase/helicase
MPDDLVVRPENLPETARDLAKFISQCDRVFDRAGPAIVRSIEADVPRIQQLTLDQVVVLAHELSRPVEARSPPRPVTLPDRVARLYLALFDWDLRLLKGVTTAPLLSTDGSVGSVEGYDAQTQIWCHKVPAIELRQQPTDADAREALLTLRGAFRTFPFADAVLVYEDNNSVPLVDLASAPGHDESAFIAALLTAVCRPSLPLTPALLICAPLISGAGSGKGLLVRAICTIAFGHAPHALNACRDVGELEKRIGAALIEASPALFIDNVNDTALRSDLLASTMTEPHVKVRQLGVSRLLPLSPTAFVAVTGNGVTLGEDLVRRFIVVELDTHTEDAESRSFVPGFLDSIAVRRAELLTAALTIWRWGRQNENAIPLGRPLGNYEIWTRWVRDPLLALGCTDPVERISLIKTRDPERQRSVAIFEDWWENHRDEPVTAAKLCESTQKLIDPQGRGRQFVVSALRGLVGARVGGYVLTRQAAAGKWGATTYALKRVVDQTESPMPPMHPMPTGSSSPRMHVDAATEVQGPKS